MVARKRVTRVSPLSVAKVFALIYGIAGLIVAMFLTVAMLAGGRNNAEAVFFLLVPILYAAGGFIGGLILGALYNIAANAVGGIVIDLADEQPWE